MKRQKKFPPIHFGKRVLSTVVSIAMAATLMPALPAVQAEETELLKAGAVNVTEEAVTQGQPFLSGTADSTYFRIPALISLKHNEAHKGDLVAAADARYSTSGDGGGLDTIASVSSDGGETWSYSFPLYFPDSDGYAGKEATTIIDPAIVEGKDGTVYCFADVNPTGSTTMYKEIGAGTGYVTVGGKRYLALTEEYANVETAPTDGDTAKYPYYVGDFTEGYAPILKRTDGSATGYGVDEWYNLYTVKDGKYVADLTQKQVNSDTDVQQNVYYKDSKFHVYSIGYIWVVSSKDGGRTWQNPQDINDQVKRREGEKAILVSPGQGITTASGDIVLGFYDHTGTEANWGENASLIYSSDGVNWKRSNDIPSGAGNGSWTSENEIVELEDGTLRMFTRNGKGVVAYADATKNQDGDYVMGNLVTTSVGVTSTCNVTAIKYSKKVDGKEAILVGMPGGSGRANGKIFTFLVNEDKTMTLRDTFSVPGSAGCYAYSCMTELADGGIGLLWENSGAAIRYDSFDISQIISQGYIEGLEVDVDLWAYESYTREYTVGSEFMTGIENEDQIDKNVVDIKVERGESAEKTVIPLHAHISQTASSLESFSPTPDPVLDIANAEFTLTATETENVYEVLSETTGRYLSNAESGNEYFSNPKANDMLIVNAKGEDTFRICKPEGTRYVIFYAPQMNFNANSAFKENDPSYELTLLEKQDTIGEDDPVPGYRKVSEITSGKKYLITRIWEDGTVLALYPTNGVDNQTKMVGQMRTETTSAVTTVTITGKAEGQTEAVIDGVTYHINCKGNRKIDLVAGQTYFIPNATEFSSADSSIATVEAGAESRNALFDCVSEADGSLDGYSKVPNLDINMGEAEFVVEQVGDNYHLFSPVEEVYLVNQNASNYFNGTAVAQNLIPVKNSDGTTSFEIRRVSDDNLNDRYVFFYYKRMAFDAVAAKDGFENRGDFGFEFLEKQDTVTNLDPIPGYKRVSEITSGKSYLITEYYGDGIIVLYPRNGITNQSKLYQAVDIEGAVITALVPNKTTTVTVDGIFYDVRIAKCTHEGGTRISNAVAPTCEKEGYTGDVFCALCNEKIGDGDSIPALGHDWDEGKITTQPTLEKDGVRTFTCRNDASHTRTEVISSLDFAKEELAKAIAAGNAEAAKDIYTDETKKTLDDALAAANHVKEANDKAAIVSALNALTAAVDGLVTKEYQTALDQLKEIISRQIPELDKCTETTREALVKARAAAQELIDSGKATTAKLKAEYTKVERAIDGLVLQSTQEKIDKLTELLLFDTDSIGQYTEESGAAVLAALAEGQELLDSGKATEEQLQAACDKLEKALKGLVTKTRAEANQAMDEQLTQAASLLGQKNVYTAESLAALQKAYDAAKAVRNDASKDAAAVAAATEQVKKAIAGLKKVSEEPGITLPAVGSTFTYKNAVYKVTKADAKNGTVTFVKPVKKTNRKFAVPAAAKKDGISYTVTEIANNAFKGNKKLAAVTIGKNVKKIGSGVFAGDKNLKKITVSTKVLKKVGKKALQGIHAKCVIKVPKAKRAAYKKVFKGKGQKASVKIK